MTKKSLFLIPVLVGFFAPVTVAAPYSAELSLDYEETEVGSTDTDTIDFAGRYYFSPVNTGNGPLQEAAFIERADSIAFRYNGSESELGSQTINDTDSYELSGTYVHNETGWLIGAGYSDISGSGPSSPFSRTDIDGDSYSLSIGKYLLDNTTLELGYQKTEIDTRLTIFPLVFGSPVILPAPVMPLVSNVNQENTAFTLSVKHLGKMDEYYYQVRASYADTEFNARISDAPIAFFGSPSLAVTEEENADSFSIGTTFYLLNNLGFSFDYLTTDNDSTDPKSYSLGVKWFPIPNLALTVGYSETRVGSFQVMTLVPNPGGTPPFTSVPTTVSLPDGESFSLGASFRF